MVTALVAAKFTEAVASELGRMTFQKAISRFRVGRTEAMVFFTLSTDFYEMASYDESNTALSEALGQLQLKGNTLHYDKCIFIFDVNWDMIEGCVPVEGSWLDDAVGEKEQTPQEILASTCVSGFQIKLYPISQGIDPRQVVTTAYIVLERIASSLRQNRLLRIRTTIPFAAVVTEEETSRRINAKLVKSMKRKQLLDGTQLRAVRGGKMLLTLPMTERMTGELLADSLRSWRPF